MSLKVERVQGDRGVESFYLWNVVQGLAVTVRHAVTNLRAPRAVQTTNYPEEKKVMPPGYRGKHRLVPRPDGSPKCTACMMCATVCPARCINIEAGEHPDPTIEKFPVQFDIDLLKCVFCGYCVEACPVDAIRMDSGVYTFAEFNRSDFVAHKEQLLATLSQWAEPR